MHFKWRQNRSKYFVETVRETWMWIYLFVCLVLFYLSIPVSLQIVVCICAFFMSSTDIPHMCMIVWVCVCVYVCLWQRGGEGENKCSFHRAEKVNLFKKMYTVNDKCIEHFCFCRFLRAPSTIRHPKKNSYYLLLLPLVLWIHRVVVRCMRLMGSILFGFTVRLSLVAALNFLSLSPSLSVRFVLRSL